MRFSTISCLLAAASSTLAQGDIAALLQSQPNLSTLLEYVAFVPGLVDTLNSASNITILAPSNEAFEQLLQVTSEEETGFPEADAVRNRQPIAVSALLANHVIKGYYPSDTITNVPAFVQTTLNTSFVNERQEFTNVTGGNYIGVVANGDGVAVLSGENSVSNVTQADIRVGENVVIHVIDNVLKFGAPFQTFTGRAGLVAFNNALQLANLSDAIGIEENSQTLFNDADLTVFIPRDEAFELIGSILAGIDVDTLEQILTYHVVRGNIIFSPSFSNTTVTSFQGSDLTLTVGDDGGLYVDGARVIYPNSILFNGVVHIIDGVLNPAADFDRTALPPNAQPQDRIAYPDAVAALPFTTFPALTDQPYTTPALLQTIQAYATPTAAVSGGGANATGTSTGGPPAFTGAAVRTATGSMGYIGGAIGAVVLGGAVVGGLL